MTEKQICPVCNQETQPVHVHGHYQCSVCGINIAPCCDGGQCETEEAEEKPCDPFISLSLPD